MVEQVGGAAAFEEKGRFGVFVRLGFALFESALGAGVFRLAGTVVSLGSTGGPGQVGNAHLTQHCVVICPSYTICRWRSFEMRKSLGERVHEETRL